MIKINDLQERAHLKRNSIAGLFVLKNNAEINEVHRSILWLDSESLDNRIEALPFLLSTLCSLSKNRIDEK